jgi:predicted nucleic acid-binding protein
VPKVDGFIKIISPFHRTSSSHCLSRKHYHKPSRIRKIYSDRVLDEKAEDILRKYQDQDFSYADAVSFAVMKQYGIGQAFSFDEHFITAGFTLIP